MRRSLPRGKRPPRSSPGLWPLGPISSSYDDMREGLIGDILHYANVNDINLFGSKHTRFCWARSLSCPQTPALQGLHAHATAEPFLTPACDASAPHGTLAIRGARLRLRGAHSPLMWVLSGPASRSARTSVTLHALLTNRGHKLPVHVLPYLGVYVRAHHSRFRPGAPQHEKPIRDLGPRRLRRGRPRTSARGRAASVMAALPSSLTARLRRRS